MEIRELSKSCEISEMRLKTGGNFPLAKLTIAGRIEDTTMTESLKPGTLTLEKLLRARSLMEENEAKFEESRLAAMQFFTVDEARDRVFHPEKYPAPPVPTLKPCPFCACSQIKSKAEPGFSATDDSWSVICEGCGVTINRCDKEEAEALWNQRA